MINNKKFLIFEVVMGVIVIGLIASIFYVNIDLGIFKLVSQKTLMSQFTLLKDLDTKLLTAKTNYDNIINTVENSKSDYKKQKDQYEAITDETIAIIKEATTDEKYNVEYMWIKLGNYAKSNNLTLTLVEPGGSVPAAPTSGTTQTTSTTTPTTTSSGTDFTISVKGNYTDTSEFIFDLENDTELRFKLDKIKMEYAGNNEITTSFSVKNLKFVK